MDSENTSFFLDFISDICDIDDSKLSPEQLQNLLISCSEAIKEYVDNRGTMEREDLMNDVSEKLISKRWPRIYDPSEVHNEFETLMKQYRQSVSS